LAAHGLRAKKRQRICHPTHRAAIERRITRECHSDWRCCHRAHNQTDPSTGIAAIDHVFRFRKTADTDTLHGPFTAAVVGHGRAKRAHRLGRVQHVFAFEQACDPCLTHRQRAQNQRAVRDGFIAGHIGFTLQGAAWAGRHGNGGAVTGHIVFLYAS
jgi:hypothetical protein